MTIVIILLIIIIIILLFGRDGFESVLEFVIKASFFLVLAGILLFILFLVLLV